MKRLNACWIRPQRSEYCSGMPASLWAAEDGFRGYCPRVFEYCRRYDFGQKIRHAVIYAMADVSYRLYVNGDYVGAGPMVAGGDIFTSEVLPMCNPCTYELWDREGLDFSVLVVAAFMKQADFSSTVSGLSLVADVELADGTRKTVATDEGWQVRLQSRYTVSDRYNQPYRYDGTLPLAPLEGVQRMHSRWRVAEPVVPTVIEEEIPAQSVTYNEENALALWDYDRIYAAYLTVENPTDAPITVRINTEETPNFCVDAGTWVIAPGEVHRSLKLYSIGSVQVQGEGAKYAKLALHYSHQPFGEGGEFRSSDEGLNRLYALCRHTMQICRQSWHLDSPRHQEPLACTGDYYVETLMCAMADGDMRLSKQDLIRTAHTLLQTEGKMFHTSYSLIFVRMLEDVYRFTADEGLLRQCYAAVELLFDRFEGYHGPLGLLEYAPDYMFLDWQTVDGYSLHHPPMALGQTALCAFYYAALCSGEQIAGILGDGARASLCRERREALKKALWEHLYSEKDGAFLSGFGGDVCAKECRWLPKNPDKTYITLHANALCVWAGIAEGDEGRRIFRRVMEDGTLPDYQPYFAHFVLEAAAAVGLYGEYGHPMMARFVQMADACPKGLQEGWILPPGGYGFDHSHAWGGTPAWQLPVRFLGLRIEEPGMKRLSLAPNLFGLSHAHVEVPVPGGRLCVTLKEGEPPVYTAPEGVEVFLRNE